MDDGVNINTIAKRAGVSTTTVSNFMNFTETIPISIERSERIMEVMREANYRPNAASSRLRRKAGQERAVFIYGNCPEDSPFNTYKNPMLSELIGCIGERLQEDMGLLLKVKAISSHDIAVWNECIAEATVLICYGRLCRQLLSLSTRRNIPLVIISDTPDAMDPEVSARVDQVYWDAPSHLASMLDHVVDRGARRIAFVSSYNIRDNNPEGFAIEAEAKISAFQTYLSAHNDLSGDLFYPAMPQNLSPYFEARNAYDLMRQSELGSYDAILGHNDLVAQGISWALQEKGVMPGRDVLVCGEGDYAEYRYSIPPLTSISYDKTELAGQVCRILQRRIHANHAMGEHILIPSTIKDRGSFRMPSQQAEKR